MVIPTCCPRTWVIEAPWLIGKVPGQPGLMHETVSK